MVMPDFSGGSFMLDKNYMLLRMSARVGAKTVMVNGLPVKMSVCPYPLAVRPSHGTLSLLRRHA
jgi:hypothetical protein